MPIRALKAGLLASSLIAALSSQPAHAKTLEGDLIERVSIAVDADAARLEAVFKDLHAHPELAFTETRTAAIVARELAALGYDVTTGIGGTGVVGVLRNGPGKTIWYRADMDANGVQEITGLPYAATTRQTLPDGSEQWAMHACGHDAHVTWLLGTARVMAQMKDAWSGTLVVYAQPAEEVGLGAQAMVKDGLLERGFPAPDVGFGSHTAPGPVGAVSNSPGVRMAGTDQLDIHFTGLGGHGSTPQMTIDPVVMAAQAVLSYQTIISRNLDPQSAAVLSVGAIEAGRDNNVIPQTATLKLNLRWFDSAVRDMMIRRIDEISRGVAISAGVPDEQLPTRTMKGSAVPLVNDAALVGVIDPALKQLLGETMVVNNFPAVTGSEDFQEVMVAADVPYVFLLIGVAPMEDFVAAVKAGRMAPYSNHNPDFFVDLKAIALGTKVNAVSVLSLLAM
ncbi:MAG: amidohydrolase [Porphyrobacter sp. HL-46]|nr:MAG: amidohydrolase [Porphyrobacter sp. HL-46]